MADDGEKKADQRFDFIKDRIASGFPKLGAKLDKMLQTDDVRYVICTWLPRMPMHAPPVLTYRI